MVDTPDLIARLFVGVGGVGIWDELFFICTVFALLRRHFRFWQANVLQTIVFVSFLWELGYQAWGPLLTIPFALLQGFIFMKTRSLGVRRDRAPALRRRGVPRARARPQSRGCSTGCSSSEARAARMPHRALVRKVFPSPIRFIRFIATTTEPSSF